PGASSPEPSPILLLLLLVLEHDHQENEERRPTRLRRKTLEAKRHLRTLLHRRREDDVSGVVDRDAMLVVAHELVFFETELRALSAVRHATVAVDGDALLAFRADDPHAFQRGDD